MLLSSGEDSLFALTQASAIAVLETNESDVDSRTAADIVDLLSSKQNHEASRQRNIDRKGRVKSPLLIWTELRS